MCPVRNVTHVSGRSAELRLKPENHLVRTSVVVARFRPIEKNISQYDGMIMQFIMGCEDKRNPA